VESDQLVPSELALATRNHGLPLEALAYDVTPPGLHYLLIHYDIPVVDPSTWRLTIGGRVRRELNLSLDDLKSRPAITRAVTMECAGNGRARLTPRPVSQPWLVEAVGTGEWTGTPLRGLLEDAGVEDGSTEVLFTGLDRGVEGGIEQQFQRSLPIIDALGDYVLLAYALGGEPLPPQHGFPLRLVVPGWYGMTNVKWLERITVLDEPFQGFQQAWGYRLRQTSDEPGVPVTRMMPRALMVPPGIPDFASRRRHLEPGAVEVTGRAWSGFGAVVRVEFSADGGGTWEDAKVGMQVSPYAWCPWSHRWSVETPGESELCCRATDEAGNTQPLVTPWNLGGFANNEVQRVPVTVSSGG
jgi:sulfane dehydrogenase subunit SoxC